MAERERFELSRELTSPYRFSKPAPSAAWVTLHDYPRTQSYLVRTEQRYFSTGASNLQPSSIPMLWQAIIKSMNSEPSRRFVVAVTGASGAIYAISLLRRMAPLCDHVDVILSETAPAVLATEMGITLTRPYSAQQYLGGPYPAIRFLSPKDYFTAPASGSYVHDGMIVLPCSMGTIGRIASGVSDDLICRAADVCLKERRRLILVPRETPYNLIHLRNMTALAEAGATILPASPSFYHQPVTIDDLVDTVVARILQNAGFEQEIVPAWQADVTDRKAS